MHAQLNHVVANERFNDIRRDAAAQRLANSMRETRVEPERSGRRTTRVLGLARRVRTA